MVGRTVVCLNWHGIGAPPRPLDPGEDRTWVDIPAFERTLDLLVDRDDVMITFDDGNASDVDIALPRLVERGLSAQFFVIAGRLGGTGFLDATALTELVDAGMRIGSHGWAHRDWRTLRPDEVDLELYRAPRIIADITGSAVDTVAIPFGSYDRGVLARLRAARVSRAYTSDGGRTRSDQSLQSRTSLRRDTSETSVRALLDGRPPLVGTGYRAAVRWAKRNRY